MKIIKEFAYKLINMFNMYDEPFDWMCTCGWLFLAVSFLTGSGIVSIAMLWQNYGWWSLILDIVVGAPAVVVYGFLAIVYAYIAYVLSNVEDPENSDYRD